jgi:hypothetical protein
MARRQDNESGRKDSLIDRRSVLQAVGGAAAAVAFGSGVSTVSAQEFDAADNVVDLGKEGLSSGDNIDPYFEEYFSSGNEVHIPAGEYDFTGAGLGGDKSDCALIGSPKGVVLHRPDDPEETVRPSTFAESGTVRVENLTIKGEHGQEQSRWRMGAAEEGRMEAVNVNLPDGTVDESDSTGIYAGTDHAGLLWVKSCYFSNFGNVALYVSDPYSEGNGQVIVEDCNFVNTGMSGLRFASDDSICRRCYFEATEKAPAGHGGWNQRGIKIDDPGENVLFEDIDMYWTDAGAVPFQFDDKGEGGSGTLRNVRIRNDSDTATFKLQWDGIEDNWSGENIHLSGEASHDAPDSFETVTGDEAKAPNREYEIWTPVDGAAGPDGPTAGAGSGSSDDDDTSQYGHRLLLEASEDNPDKELDVSFTMTEEIRYGEEAEPEIDEIEENDDGTYTATSIEMNPGALDSYRAKGDLVDYSVTDGYDITVSVDGTETSFEELHEGDGESEDNSADGSEESGSSGNGSDDSGSGAAPQKTIIVDGTGDSSETAKYKVSVSGTIERDEQRTTVAEDSLPWDRVRDYVGDSRAIGFVGNGQDAFRFTGSLQSVTIDGDASLSILEG